MTREESQIHQDRVNFGERAKTFLASRDWLDLVKPIISSMVKGVTDVRSLKKSDFSSDVKAQALILGHQITAEYLERIELLIGAYVTDGEVSRKLLEKQQKVDPDALYKTEED